ncbi:MAG: hypothetical protein ACSLEX_03525 [Minisyncoccota bacterium]
MTEKRKKTVNLTALLVESVFGNLQIFLDGILAGASEATRALTTKIALHASLFVLVLLGIIFALVGVAQFIEAHYQLAGIGAIVVGSALLILVFLIRLFSRESI